MNPGSRKIFRAKPPDKGSFPLDHDGMKTLSDGGNVVSMYL